MSGVLPLATVFSRSRRMKAYRRMKAEIEALPAAELADMGLKRAQAGTVARKLALR